MHFISPEKLFHCQDTYVFVLTFWSQPGQQTIVIHILLNISRIKGNQTMKFDHLIECNIRNVFPERSCTNCDGETSPGPFSQKLKLSISLDHQSKVLYILLLLYGKLRSNILKLFFFFFFFFKKRSGTSLPASFSA